MGRLKWREPRPSRASELTACQYREASAEERVRSHYNTKPAVSNSSGLKSVFEKLRFRGRLVWTVGVTVEISCVFKHFSGLVRLPKVTSMASFVPVNILIFTFLLGCSTLVIPKRPTAREEFKNKAIDPEYIRRKYFFSSRKHGGWKNWT